MANITISGNKETILDNNLLISSTSIVGQDVLRVDSVTNRIAINKNTAATATLDVEGSVAISTTLNVQGNKLIVDPSGRIGINATPSGTYQLQTNGSTYISNSLQVVGSYVRFDATTLEILDSNITINKSGTDATSAGAGFTVQRTSDNAQFIWDNTRQNFRVGLVSNTTALLRASGNTEGASFSIGTNDNFNFHIKTNNIDRMTISNAGDTTFTGATVTVAGEATVQGLNIKDFLPPPGTIIAFIPGVFGDASNGSFSLILGATNTVASVNTWLSSNGYSHWKVCDGTSYNIAGSALYGGASRFTPNLVDQRFLAGSTASASTGGTNSGAHTHTTTNSLTAVDISHSHSVSSSVCVPGGTNPILTSTNASTGTPTQVSPSTPTANLTYANSGSTGGSGLSNINISHSHGGSCSHCHGSAYYAHIGYAPGVSPTAFIAASEKSTPSWSLDCYVQGPVPWIPENKLRPSACINGNTSSASMSIGGASSLGSPSQNFSSFSLDHTHSIASHTHSLNNHTHSFPSHSHGGGSHTHTICAISWTCGGAFNTQFCHSHTTNAQTGPGSTFQGTENRPLYLTCFYLVRVI